MGKKAKIPVGYEDPNASGLQRLAIINTDRCKPSKCNQECKRQCPINLQGKQCISVMPQSQNALIAEGLCIGCGICTKKCPFDAIRIVNLPGDLKTVASHRHGLNGFKLHQLPLPRRGRALGLLGSNGIGKSTALDILAGRTQPNLGSIETPPDWKAITAHFRGSELQKYFERISEGKFTAAVKPQDVESFASQEGLASTTSVAAILAAKDEKQRWQEVAGELELMHLLGREVGQLSGGELQRLAIAAACIQDADTLIFDEPSAYLDLRQRLVASKTIHDALQDAKHIIVVEHDLTVLDYIADYVCCLWGSPGAYGTVAAPSGTKEAINCYLAGYIPTENLRIRDEPLTFQAVKNPQTASSQRLHNTSYPQLQKTLKSPSADGSTFELNVEAGNFASSEVVVLLGENGTGKSTLIKMLAGTCKPDSGEVLLPELGNLSVSWKPQMFERRFEGSVRELLQIKIRDAYADPAFQTAVVRPMQIAGILDLQVKTLSGGQAQRVAIVLTLGKPADLYLLDEPSAYLDVEQRVAVSKVIRRFVLDRQKTAFVVEHDFLMASYIADQVIVFDGQPGRRCRASAPVPMAEGMNRFLSQIGVTFRRSHGDARPRVNKIGGSRDREQKQSGQFFFEEQY